jgi:hypothetical protein
VTYRSTARQRVAKHIPATTNISTPRQRRGKHVFATIEETVFSMGPPRDHTSSPVVNRRSVEFRAPAGQNMSLEAEELNRGIEASELLSAG